VDKLKDRGADVFSAILPRTQDDGKQGLDDWFVNNPGVDFNKAVMALKVPVTEHAAMQTMRLRYVFVSAQDAVFDLKTQTLSARPAFNVAVSNTNFEVFKFDTEAMTFKARKVDLGSAYLSSPARKTVHTMDYAPASPQFIDSLEGLPAVNTWRPRHVDPVKGDVSVFKRLLEAQVDHNDPGWEMHCKWLTQRLAYPYKFPGMKLQTAVVIYGPEGTGKSTVGEIMLQLYGTNGASVDQQALEADFNMAHANKEFLLCDEVANRRGKMDMVTRFKALITRKTMRVNGKNVKEYYARSFEQYYITTNEDDAIVMAKEDRRYFVGHNTGADIEVVRLASSIFKDPDMLKVKGFKEFEAQRAQALQAIAYYLTHEVDLSNFEPYANPPRTQAKEEMTIINRSNAETFLHEVYETSGMLQELGAIAIKEKFTTFEAIHLAYAARQELGGFKADYIGRNGFGSLMKKVGLIGYKLKSGPNANKTVYPLQDHEQWTPQLVAEHFNCAVAATSGDKTTYSPTKVSKKK
jgi:nicotinamide riboside kinase